jgi:hypothetical protein
MAFFFKDTTWKIQFGPRCISSVIPVVTNKEMTSVWYRSMVRSSLGLREHPGSFHIKATPRQGTQYFNLRFDITITLL